MDNNEILDYVSYVDEYIIDSLVQIIINCTSDETIHSEYNKEVSEIYPAVSLQYYYNDQYNKCYIEFRFNKLFKINFEDQLVRIIERFQNSIKENFKDDTTVWPELVLISYKRRKICDSSPILTPFTIGYWKSLTGQYEFITDQVKVLYDYAAMAAPVQSDEYNTKVEQIYNTYYKTNFTEFTKQMYKASLDYGAKYDKPPKKNFVDFINSVEELDKSYQQTFLNEQQKQNFINDYMTLVADHLEDPNYETLLNNLYNQYGLKTKLQEKVPEIFEQYKTLYENFMETRLPVIDVDYDHNDDKVEIWWYEGDFDFGSLEEGTDPDSVAKEDYDYDKAAFKNIILNSNYDIRTGKVTE